MKEKDDIKSGGLIEVSAPKKFGKKKVVKKAQKFDLVIKMKDEDGKIVDFDEEKEAE